MSALADVRPRQRQRFAGLQPGVGQNRHERRVANQLALKQLGADRLDGIRRQRLHGACPCRGGLAKRAPGSMRDGPTRMRAGARPEAASSPCGSRPVRRPPPTIAGSRVPCLCSSHFTRTLRNGDVVRRRPRRRRSFRPRRAGSGARATRGTGASAATSRWPSRSASRARAPTTCGTRSPRCSSTRGASRSWRSLRSSGTTRPCPWTRTCT